MAEPTQVTVSMSGNTNLDGAARLRVEQALKDVVTREVAAPTAAPSLRHLKFSFSQSTD